MEFPINNKIFQEEAISADHAKRMVVMGNKIVVNEGVFDAFGHISVRNPENPETFFISRALAPVSVTLDDLIEMDFNAKIVGGNPGFTPFSESAIHCSIYKARPDVNCVCHPHPYEIIPFTCVDVPLSGMYHLYTFYDGIPVFSDLPPECGLLINNLELGDKLAAVLGDKRGVLIRNHGVVVVGETLPRTVFSTVTLRDNAKMLATALSMGVKITSFAGAEEIKKSTNGHFCGQPAKRAWDYWCKRARESFPEIADMDVSG